MKARIVPVSELWQTPAQVEAESLLRQLTPDTAIEITPGRESIRSIKRTFKLAADRLGLAIRFRQKNDALYVRLARQPP